MKALKFIMVFAVSLCFGTIAVAQDYLDYLNAAKRLLKEGDCIKAEMNYSVYKYLSGTSSLEIEAAIKKCKDGGDNPTFDTLNSYEIVDEPKSEAIDNKSDVIATTGTLNGYEWVDLGLPSGTLWATCNVGASKPEEYGNYYAWGETSTKATYTKDNYTYSRYPTTLPPSADAATANWGSGWRMPTQTEIQELIDNCTVTWTTQNGVNGRLFTGSNGNSIFLPAAGSRTDSALYVAGSYGYYWSSSLDMSRAYYAWHLYFGSGDYNVDGNSRYYGRSVRPVCQPTPTPTSMSEDTDDGIFYRILLFALKKDKPVESFGVPNLKVREVNGVYKYYLGDFSSKSEADKVLKKYRTQYPEAIILQTGRTGNQ